MTIYQPETDTIWEFWKARKTDEGRWEACHGGRMENASKKDGRWHSFYGTTATGLPLGCHAAWPTQGSSRDETTSSETAWALILRPPGKVG